MAQQNKASLRVAALYLFGVIVSLLASVLYYTQYPKCHILRQGDQIWLFLGPFGRNLFSSKWCFFDTLAYTNTFLSGYPVLSCEKREVQSILGASGGIYALIGGHLCKY